MMLVNQPSHRSGQHEQRQALRLALGPGEASLEHSGPCPVALTDLSVSGAGLILPVEFEHDRELAGVLRLGPRRATVRLKPTRVALEMEKRRLGARFLDPTRETLKSVGDFLIEGFLRKQRILSHLDRPDAKTLRIRNASLIFDLLRDKTLERGLPLHLYRDDALLGRAFVKGLHRHSEGFWLSISLGAPLLSDRSVYGFAIPEEMAITRFTARVTRTSDVVFVEGPREIEQCGFRQYVRHTVDGPQSLLIRLRHPRIKNGSTRTTLAELSAGGFSFSVGRDAGLILPGDTLPEVVLDLPSGGVSVVARVRRVAPTGDGKGFECGLEILHFESEQQREQWERFVLEKTHARVKASEPGLERPAWDVLTSSGYLDLWTAPKDHQRLANGFHASWQGVSPQVGRLLVLSDSSRHIATFATSRLYPRTWLVHSFGVDKAEMRRIRHFIEIARDLYSALALTLQRSPEAKYFGGYFERDQRWADILYGGFVASYSDTEASLYDDFRLFKWHSGGPPAPPVNEDVPIQVAPANAPDLSALSERLRQTVSPLEYDAFSYGPLEIGLDEFSASCRNARSERSRQVYVAREGGVAAAALVAESGSEGESVFGLLDRCWIVWWPDCTLRSAIKERLLAAAVGHYARLGRQEAIFLETDDVAVTSHQPFRFVSAGRRWLARLELIPAWRTYVDQVLRSRVR